MAVALKQVDGSTRTFRAEIMDIAGGWSTRTYPHLLPDNKLPKLENMVSVRDGLWNKRPGNGNNSAVGTGLPILSMTRFYPASGAPILVAHSGTGIWTGASSAGPWTQLAAGSVVVSSSQPCSFAQFADPENAHGPTVLFICDGAHVPWTWDGTNAPTQVSTAGGTHLPVGRGGSPITPKYVVNWDLHLVYSGQSDEPSGVYIADALTPESFTGSNFVASNATSYTAYFPGGRDGDLGAVTGIMPLGAVLVVFFACGIVIGQNTGSYGATQYVWTRLPGRIGAVAPRSIVSMDTYIAFFGGDRFYVTDANAIYPLPDELPTLYSATSRSSSPPLIKNAQTVFAARRGTEYVISYDSAASGHLDQIAVFDAGANGSFSFGQQVTGQANEPASKGGAWYSWPSGMTMNAAIECRSGSDVGAFPFYWGSSLTDQVYQHDIGTFDDAGSAIAVQLQTKTFFFDEVLGQKTIQGVYAVCVFDVLAATYSSAPQVFAYADSVQEFAPPVTVAIAPTGATYGTKTYGTFQYSAGVSQIEVPLKFYPAALGPGQGLSFGVIENSKNPFGIIGFIVEFTVDPPAP